MIKTTWRREFPFKRTNSRNETHRHKNCGVCVYVCRGALDAQFSSKIDKYTFGDRTLKRSFSKCFGVLIVDRDDSDWRGANVTSFQSPTKAEVPKVVTSACPPRYHRHRSLRLSHSIATNVTRKMNAGDGTGMTKLAVIDEHRHHSVQVHVVSSIATDHFDCECHSIVGIGRE